MNKQFIESVTSSFQEQKDDERAIKMTSYLKDQFPFYGVPSPARKIIQRSLFKQFSFDRDVFPETKKLFSLPQRELQYFAMEFYFRHRKHWTDSSLNNIMYLVQTKSWWDTVDLLSSWCLGYYFQHIQPEHRKTILEFNQSSDMWVRRSSLLFQLKYKDQTDTELMADCIKNLSQEKEFFIKKAIGWILREYAKTDPDWVRSFVDKNTLQNLSVKEALKNIS